MKQNQHQKNSYLKINNEYVRSIIIIIITTHAHKCITPPRPVNLVISLLSLPVRSAIVCHTFYKNEPKNVISQAQFQNKSPNNQTSLRGIPPTIHPPPNSCCGWGSARRKTGQMRRKWRRWRQRCGGPWVSLLEGQQVEVSVSSTSLLNPAD